MIIISSGFPKSASTLLFLYTEHLLKLSGQSRGQKLFRRLNKEGFTPWFGPFNTVWYVIASMFGPVVIKTHAGPGFFVRILLGLGIAKAYYSIRDPRDVVNSALDHARKARSKPELSNSDKAFAPFRSIEDMRPALRMHFNRFLGWKEDGRVLLIRYENLMINPGAELKKVVNYIGRPELEKFVSETVNWFAERKSETINFNKGAVTRFETELSKEEMEVYERELRELIVSMEYKLSNPA